MIRKEQWNRLLKYLARGVSVTDSAKIARINLQYVYNYRAKHPEFAKAMEIAQMATDVRAIRLVRRAMGEQWQAAAWWLERKRPDEFALKNKLEMSFNFQKSDKFKEIDDDKIIEVLSDNKRIESAAE